MKSQTAKKQTKLSPKRLVGHRNRTAPGEASKKAHSTSGEPDRFWMLCPRCGLGLIETVTGVITTEKCTACGAVWADRGDIERLPEKDILAVFKKLPNK